MCIWKTPIVPCTDCFNKMESYMIDHKHPELHSTQEIDEHTQDCTQRKGSIPLQ